MLRGIDALSAALGRSASKANGVAAALAECTAPAQHGVVLTASCVDTHEIPRYPA
jgi:hypothetical protein